MSVCLFILSARISQKTRPNFTIFSTRVTRGCGSVILWRQCDTLCTSGFMDDVIFSHNTANGKNQRRHIYLVEFARWRHRGWSLPSATAACFAVSSGSPAACCGFQTDTSPFPPVDDYSSLVSVARRHRQLSTRFIFRTALSPFCLTS